MVVRQVNHDTVSDPCRIESASFVKACPYNFQVSFPACPLQLFATYAIVDLAAQRHSELSCNQGESGPSHESMQAVFDLQAFRPVVNLSNPTVTNISFTLYAVLGVVSLYLNHF